MPKRKRANFNGGKQQRKRIRHGRNKSPSVLKAKSPDSVFNDSRQGVDAFGNMMGKAARIGERFLAVGDRIAERSGQQEQWREFAEGGHELIGEVKEDVALLKDISYDVLDAGQEMQNAFDEELYADENQIHGEKIQALEKHIRVADSGTASGVVQAGNDSGDQFVGADKPNNNIVQGAGPAGDDPSIHDQYDALNVVLDQHVGNIPQNPNPVYQGEQNQLIDHQTQVYNQIIAQDQPPDLYEEPNNSFFNQIPQAQLAPTQQYAAGVPIAPPAPPYPGQFGPVPLAPPIQGPPRQNQPYVRPQMPNYIDQIRARRAASQIDNYDHDDDDKDIQQDYQAANGMPDHLQGAMLVAPRPIVIPPQNQDMFEQIKQGLALKKSAPRHPQPSPYGVVDDGKTINKGLSDAIDRFKPRHIPDDPFMADDDYDDW